MHFKFSVFVLSLFVASASCSAADLWSGSRAEIDALLNRLGESGCQFNRNGTWYSADKAKAHLAMKLNYLVDLGRLESTEQFIELAASKSSMSGKDYLVACQDEPAVPSATWLTGELQALRLKERLADPPVKGTPIP